jgi:hypothetical protein
MHHHCWGIRFWELCDSEGHYPSALFIDHAAKSCDGLAHMVILKLIKM